MIQYLALLCLMSGCSTVRKNEPIDQVDSIAEIKTERLTRLKFESGGRQRSVLVWLPRDHVFDRTNGLLFVLHGGGGNAEQMVKTSGMNKHGNDFQFVFAYPQGVDERWADGRGTTEPELAGVDDVSFFRELIDAFAASGAVNPEKVYSTGISNGGFMSFRLACELSEKVRGIAPVATAFQTRLDESCQSTSSSAVYFIHGDADRFVPKEGGEIKIGPGGNILSTEATVNKWLGLFGCTGLGSLQTKDSISFPTDHTSLERRLGEGCAAGKKFKFVNVRGGGHTWPGGGYQPALVLGATSRELDASKSILEYFSE